MPGRRRRLSVQDRSRALTNICSITSGALASGGAIGSVVAGSLSLAYDWRVIYYIGAGLIGLNALLIYLTMPETAFVRNVENLHPPGTTETAETYHKGTDTHVEEARYIPAKKTFAQNLTLFPPRLTTESLVRIFTRPLVLILLPPILWASVTFGLGVGVIVIASTTIATAFQQIYGFSTFHLGLLWIAVLIGSLLGIPISGYISDWIPAKLTSRNNGVREPEMRLPTLIVAMIVFPIGLLMYGFGIEYQTHWIVPAIGIVFC